MNIDTSGLLHTTTNAHVWAKVFMALIGDHPEEVIDEKLMVAWFAEAIERGRDSVTIRRKPSDLLKDRLHRSVQPNWCRALPLQQQSVLLLAARGPDGIPKTHPCKDVQRAYRGTVLCAARYGRPLGWGEKSVGDDFMALDKIAHENEWNLVVARFFDTVDELPHHFLLHLLHGAEILGYKHPDQRMADRWWKFYIKGCADMHVTHETELEMDARLADWGREEW